VLRRVDNTNGGALLGTAYRDALENDFDANGDRRETELGRNGGQEPSDPNNPNKPRKPSDRVPPPFGCVPPPSQCFWSSNPIAPDGFQGYGSAVVNEEGVPLYLYCVAGTAVSPDLNCDFLRWKCVNGQCLQMSGGTYGTKQECESALRWNANVYTLGICRSGLPANNCILDGILPNTLVRTFNISNAQYPISVVIDNRIPPGYIGFNHYKFVDALGVEIDYIPASSAGYYIVYSRVCP
jgi:hypothetical protein